MRPSLRWISVVFSLGFAAQALAQGAPEKLQFGISAPMSGAAAQWGVTMDWVAKQASDQINKSGGIKAGGKVYQIEVLTLDNKFTAQDGAKVAQELIQRRNIRYIVGSVGTAPVRALQSISEREGVVMFTTAWGPSIKGPKFPFTFTQSNTPIEILPPLYKYVKDKNPSVKTVFVINPNDATGEDTQKENLKSWNALGIKVLSTNFYERGTTEFSPLATKVVQQAPDILDLSAMTPGEAGLLLKAVQIQGWKGVKVHGSGASARQLLKVAGDAADGVYMGLAGDFVNSPLATPTQRALQAKADKDLGEELNTLSISIWDAIMAVKAGMEKANSIDPKAVKDVMPSVVFESSYGRAGFGGAASYGSPQQMLVPVLVTQLQGDKLVELARVNPAELK